MSQLVLDEQQTDWEEYLENVEIEDDQPVDNIISAKQMRLLVEPLYSSWRLLTEDNQPRKFFADCNVGIFWSRHENPIVPDMFLSLDVEANSDFYRKENRSYFVWEFGKTPEVAVEIVSNKKGDELEGKMKRHAQIAVSYYVIFDPLKELSGEILRVYELAWGGRRYHLRKDYALPYVGLSLTLWRGKFEGIEFEWLRWCDKDGKLIPTGKERAEAEAERVKRLAEKLREPGVDPEKI